MPSLALPFPAYSSDELRSMLDAQPVENPEFQLVDVRQDAEYAEGHIPGARLVPLPELADRLGELDRAKPVVAYCRSGKRSAAGAMLLLGQGFTVGHLEGGFMGWEGAAAVGLPAFGMEHFTDLNDSKDILRVAFRMEGALGDLYEGLAADTAKSGHKAVSDLLTRLSGMESGHQQMVFDLARRLDTGVRDIHAYGQGLTYDVLEGGMTAKEFLASAQASGAQKLTTPAAILDLAMSAEAQALDLYLRAADKAADANAKATFLELAEAEKAHVAELGRMLEKTLV